MHYYAFKFQISIDCICKRFLIRYICLAIDNCKFDCVTASWTAFASMGSSPAKFKFLKNFEFLKINLKRITSRSRAFRKTKHHNGILFRYLCRLMFLLLLLTSPSPEQQYRTSGSQNRLVRFR